MKKIFISTLVLASSLCFGQDSISLGVTKLGQYSYNHILNDVWGYADGNGNEYALVGNTAGVSIVDVTDPANPVEEHFVAGASSTWRDIKTWGHYAYVVHDSYAPSSTSDGILIIDLNTIGSSTLVTSNYFPTVHLGNDSVYDRAHNLYVDENGVLYVFGINRVGGALMLDVNADPVNPPLLGSVNNIYYHDGVARGDTLWGAGIDNGIFEVVDVSNKANPVQMATKGTPHSFTHNIWFSGDNKTVFTTDEKEGAFVVSYDVSDLNNITELDRIRTSIFDPTKVVPHNVHVKGDFLVTSYYTSGLQIVDASHPDIMVETAYYDTSPKEGGGYMGAWGAYPYLPSGVILVSDRQEGLFILNSDYPRASFFRAEVKDLATGNSIFNANIEMLNSQIAGTSSVFGRFKDGQRDTGTFEVVTSKNGYHNDTMTVQMQAGVVTDVVIELTPIGFSLDEDPSNSSIKVFPNPSPGQITLELPVLTGPAVEISITNMKGQEVYRRSVDAATNVELDTGLGEGIYLLEVKNGENILDSQRLVISH